MKLLSDRVIVLYYRGFTCGKFVSNILSFNDNFLPQMIVRVGYRKHPQIKRLLPRVGLTEEILREIKIDHIFGTIPPTKDDCKNWMEYELGCGLFWGMDCYKGILNPVTVALIEKGLYGFIVAHDATELQNRLTIFPNATVLEIVNDENVYQMSAKLKSNIMPNLDYITPYKDSIKFEIKPLFDQDKFFKSIDQLLDNLKIQDKTLDNRVYDYYNQYIGLYQ
jgi:hypothetical protein